MYCFIFVRGCEANSTFLFVFVKNNSPLGTVIAMVSITLNSSDPYLLPVAPVNIDVLFMLKLGCVAMPTDHSFSVLLQFGFDGTRLNTQAHTHKHTHTLVLETLWRGFADLGFPPVHSMWQSCWWIKFSFTFFSSAVALNAVGTSRQVRRPSRSRSVPQELPWGSHTWLIQLDCLWFPCSRGSLLQYFLSWTVQCTLLCKTLRTVYFLHSVLRCWVCWLKAELSLLLRLKDG